MTCEVLVSTMNKQSKEEITNELNINNCVIINQVTEKKDVPKDDTTSNQKFYSYKEKGLSRSRNKAIANSIADICIVADDDMYYENNYEKIITDAYKKYEDADIIAFVVDSEDKSNRKKVLKEQRISLFKTMKLRSVQITFKRKSIIDNKILFDEQFGAGSKYPWGEENIFLFDCKKKKLKVYYIPIKIATLKYTGVSSWDRTSTKEHYQIQGIIYYRMSHFLYPILIIQFVLRKKRIYGKELTPFEVFKAMFVGVKEYKKGLL